MNENFYYDLREDWIVAATDVTNSTDAIAERRYKDVTKAGAVGTIALANHLGSLDFPYFFGGDGMFFILPGNTAETVIVLLEDTRRTVLIASGLELRAGVVPVGELFREGTTLEVGRARIAMEVMIVRFARWSGLPIRGMGKRLDRVPEENIRNADVQKLDGTLKMVLSVSPGERNRILAGLEELRREGAIHYGYHLSDRAVMTRLIHTNHQDEVHFVDSADGGYAMAARMLKEQRNRTDT